MESGRHLQSDRSFGSAEDDVDHRDAARQVPGAALAWVPDTSCLPAAEVVDFDAVLDRAAQAFIHPPAFPDPVGEVIARPTGSTDEAPEGALKRRAIDPENRRRS